MGTFHNLLMEVSANTAVLADGVRPNVPATAPDVPALSNNVYTLVGWMKWGGLVAGIVGLIVCAIMMIIGRRGKSQTAVDGASGIPWVLAGLTLIAFSTYIVNAVVP